MKKKSEDGWPRAPPNRTLPRSGLTTTVAAGDGGDVPNAAAEDDDDGGGDETPAASTAGTLQGSRQPQTKSKKNKELPRAITPSVIAAVDMKRDSPAARAPRGEVCTRQ